MAYTPTQWNDGDKITTEKMNKLEQGVKNEQIGPAGPKGDPGETGPAGADGKYITAIEQTTTVGAVTGGTATFDDESTLPITVTASEGDA